MPKQPSSHNNSNQTNWSKRFDDLFPLSAFQRSQQEQSHGLRQNPYEKQSFMNHHQPLPQQQQQAQHFHENKQLQQEHQATLLEQYFTQLLNHEPSFHSLWNQASSGVTPVVQDDMNHHHALPSSSSSDSSSSSHSNNTSFPSTSNNNNNGFNYVNNNFNISMNDGSGRISNTTTSPTTNINNKNTTNTPLSSFSSNSFLALSTSPQRNFLSSLPNTSTPLADSLSRYLEQFDQQFGFAPSSTAQSGLDPNNTSSAVTTPSSSSSSSSSMRLTTNGTSNATSTSTNDSPASSNKSTSQTEKKKKKKTSSKKKDHHSSEDEDAEGRHSEHYEENTSPGFHPIACVPCRRLHKRCDKKYPACSKCLSRGVTCEYKIPRKKGRIAKPKGQPVTTTAEKQDKNENTGTSTQNNKQDQTTEPSYEDLDVTLFTTNNHSSTNKLLTNIVQAESTPYAQGATRNQPEKHLDKRKVLDIYYNVFTEHMIVIERKEFESYLSTRTSSNSARDEDEEIITNFNETEVMPNKKEVYVLFLCIKAVCEQRVGLVDLAEETGKKARDALSKIFDEHSNFYVACAFAYLSIYEAGCGRLKTAKYYLNSLNFYFDELSQEEEEHMTLHQKNLKRLRSFANICAKNDQGVLQLLKEWPGVYEKLLGITLPTEWKTLLAQDLTINNYMAVINVVESLLKVVRLHIIKSGTVKNLKIYDMGQVFVSNGIKIGILSAVNRGKELIEECALKITLATELELFVFVPPPIVAHCAAAAKVHLHIVKAIENGERQNPEIGMVPSVSGGEPTLGTIDYYEILSKDLRALNILSKRYKKVSLFHKSLMNEMEDIIQRKHIMSAMTRVCSSFSDDYPPNNFVSGLLSDLEKMRATTNVYPLPSTQPSITDLGHNVTINTNETALENSNNFSDSEMDFSEFAGVRNTKDFLTTVVSNTSYGSNEPLQELINESFLESLNSGNMNLEDSLKDESFFEPFLNSEDIQELYAADFSPHDSPPQQ